MLQPTVRLRDPMRASFAARFAEASLGTKLSVIMRLNALLQRHIYEPDPFSTEHPFISSTWPYE